MQAHTEAGSPAESWKVVAISYALELFDVQNELRFRSETDLRQRHRTAQTLDLIWRTRHSSTLRLLRDAGWKGRPEARPASRLDTGYLERRLVDLRAILRLA